MIPQLRLFCFIFFLGLAASALENQERSQTSQPENVENEQITTLYKDMIVIQPQAFKRKNQFSLGARLSQDFSDGPQSKSAATIHVDYGLSSSWELGLYVTPLYSTQDRAIKKSIEKLKLQNGESAQLVSSAPQLSFGAECLWIISYGKDVWGPKLLIRNDTFFRFLFGATQFKGGKSGPDYGVSLGKTFYLDSAWNIRVGAGFLMSSTNIGNEIKNETAGILDGGLVWAF